jgi:hypothetical protein
MKKIIVILLLLISTAGYSQRYYSVYKIHSGPFDGNTRKFNLKEHMVNMRVTIKNDTMYVADSARSVYAIKQPTLERNDDNIVVISYKATDEKNRNCAIFTRTSKTIEDSSIIIVYSNYVFQYFISK